MPDARCPHCGEWSRRDTWTEAPGQAFPFRIVCPSCGAESDVHDIDYRLGVRARSCDRCGATAPTSGDPARQDWTLVVSREGALAEVVCPQCIGLTEIAGRMGVARRLA
jgi:hypothetical protein